MTHLKELFAQLAAVQRKYPDLRVINIVSQRMDMARKYYSTVVGAGGRVGRLCAGWPATASVQSSPPRHCTGKKKRGRCG